MYTKEALELAVAALRKERDRTAHAIASLEMLLEQHHENEGPMLTDYCDVIIYG